MSDDGRLVAGRYRLRETLGRGGMADVHVARDEVLDRDVAVKLLRSRYLADDTFLERFRREARAAARLNHPNIVAVHDTGDDDGVPYIVMELVHGRSLDLVLAERGRVTVAVAATIAVEVLAALEYAHEEGVVHRDVKPGNILVTEDGDTPGVKVADFGIARAAGDDTITLTSVLGTAAYLSPEQARGRRADHRADLYSCGIVLYELLTGSPPYGEGTAVQVALRHVGGRPQPPSEVVEGIPPDLDAVVLTALAKEPDDRYRTAAAFGRDLEAVLAGRPVSVELSAAAAAAAGLAGTDGPRSATDEGTVPIATPTDGPADDGASRGSDRRWAIAALALLLLFAVLALLAAEGADTPEVEAPTPTAPAVDASPSPVPADGVDEDDEPGPPDDGGPPDDRGPPPGRGQDG